MRPIVLQLQADSFDQAVSVSTLLRKAKIVATKLNLPEFLNWIDKELNGYDDVPAAELPSYRKLTGRPIALNPYQGWLSILFRDVRSHELFSFAPIFQAIGPAEEMLNRIKGSGGTITLQYPAQHQVELRKVLEFPTEVRIELSYAQFWGIVDAVRNIILNWSLELEKSGVLGEGLTFSEREKREAAPVSHQFFAQNIGVVGNLSDHARVTNVQTTNVQQLDYDKLAELIRQIRVAAPLMPEDRQDALVEQAAALEQEMAKDARDPSRIAGALTSLRTICEGAAGNVVAQGILALIRDLLG